MAAGRPVRARLRASRWPRATERAALLHAKRCLDRLALYPRAVDLGGLRALTVPTLFRVPGFRRFDGYATRRLLLFRRPPEQVSAGLFVHELCHVWQMQHRPWRMWLSYCRPRTFGSGYGDNPYEVEARRAAALTRG